MPAFPRFRPRQGTSKYAKLDRFSRVAELALDKQPQVLLHSARLAISVARRTSSKQASFAEFLERLLASLLFWHSQGPHLLASLQCNVVDAPR
jgi:hypothetical protein